MKTSYSTGEIAKLFSVAPRTVIKWLDTGQLVGYKLPSCDGLKSGFRRVNKDELLAFAKRSGIPLEYTLLPDNGLKDHQIAELASVIRDSIQILCGDHQSVRERVSVAITNYLSKNNLRLDGVKNGPNTCDSAGSVGQ